MHRVALVVAGLLFISGTSVAQNTQTDSQTLQALLNEVRQLRQDLRTSTAVVQRAQILIFRLQIQEQATEHASQRLVDTRARLASAQSDREKLENDIKNAQIFIENLSNPPAQRKQLEDWLPPANVRLESLKTQEQEAQGHESEAEEQQREEQSKLTDLQGQLEQLQTELENTARGKTP